MSEHVLDPPGDPASTAAALLRTGFHASADRAGEGVFLRLHGELDLATAGELTQAVEGALAARPAAMAVELGGLTFIDSTGLSALMTAHRRATDAGCAFVVRGPRRAVLRTLQVTGVDQILPIEADTTQA